MQHTTKELSWWALGAALVGAGFLLIAFLGFRRALIIKPLLWQEHQSTPGQSPAAPPVENLIRTKVIPQDAFQGTEVRYDGKIFSPAAVTLRQNENNSGCVMRIVNDGSRSLVIRLNPHALALKENYGQQYEPIPPGNSIIIDPRFNRPREAFHDHENPAQEFRVEIDQSCR